MTLTSSSPAPLAPASAAPAAGGPAASEPSPRSGAEGLPLLTLPPHARPRRQVGAGRESSAPMSVLETWLRLSLGLAWLALCSLAFALLLLVALPSRVTRIRISNVYGTFVGRGCAWLSGSTFTIGGEEHARGPAIFVSNHTSLLDIFLGIWLSPPGTCGVGKKEVVYYPLFGQFYLLSGNLRIDRGRRERAVASLRALATFVRAHGLSVFIWPEGTRSPSGRLSPFKKGAFHVALATGLPVVPMVVAGAHRAWENRSLRLRPTRVDVTFLPPIDTHAWREETLAAHIHEVEACFAAHLPEDQGPAPAATAAAA